MADYKPSAPFIVPMFLRIPQLITSKGSTKKIYPEKGELFHCSFKTFGGTETNNNGVLIIEDTAVIETWYRPDIASDCIITDVDGVDYEILGTPENINKRNQYLKFKVRAVRGGS